MSPRKYLKPKPSRKSFLRIYRLLYGVFGPRNWWPGETPFEVMIGAILTQNTAWTNVEKAIANLKNNDLLDPAKLHKTSIDALAELIKPSGYFRQKSKKIHGFLDYFGEKYAYSVETMKAHPTDKLREELLAIWGIGPETADSMLLYALDKPVFVIDAYTMRIFRRLGFLSRKDNYHSTQQMFMRYLSSEVPLYNEYHACIVALGSGMCSPRPNCEICPLREEVYCNPHET